MKTILVPTDFSACANNAMMYALELAERSGASVTVLYVIYPNEGVENNIYDAFFIEDYVEQRLQRMKVWSKKFTRSPHLKEVEIKLECKIGFPVSTICQTATELEVSLIVMGTTGSIGLLGVALGSVTSGVLAKSKTPVLAVPPKAAFRNNARFAFATDFRLPVSKNSLQVLREILYLQHTGLNIIHVSTKPGAPRDHKQEKAISEKLGTIPHDFHYIHDQDVVQAIHHFLESTECNGLVTVAHEHSLLHELFTKSVSRSLAHHSTVPILTLHDA